MKQNYDELSGDLHSELPNGYLLSINRAISGIRRFRGGMTEGTLSRELIIQKII